MSRQSVTCIIKTYSHIYRRKLILVSVRPASPLLFTGWERIVMVTAEGAKFRGRKAPLLHKYWFKKQQHKNTPKESAHVFVFYFCLFFFVCFCFKFQNNFRLRFVSPLNYIKADPQYARKLENATFWTVLAICPVSEHQYILNIFSLSSIQSIICSRPVSETSCGSP